jgi:hypothetical protein
MADSEALRSRRKRAHAANDHSLCRRCTPVRAAVPVLPAGQVSDAETGLRQLAARLTSAHEADPANAMVARELRMTLQALMPKAAADDGIGALLGDLREA